jgi:hypothetical protein
MDSSKIKLIVVGALALFGALYLGLAVATAQTEAIAWVVGGVGLAVCVTLGKRIWLLIPFLAAVNISLRITGMPSTLMIAQVLVLGFSVLLICIRRITLKPKLGELELWMILLFVMIVQVYARNPVGVFIFGGMTVGGKAYFVFLLTLVSAFYLASLVVDVKDLKRVVALSIAGSLVNISIALVGKVVPIVGYYTGANYQINQGYAAPVREAGSATRFLEASVFGQRLALWICSFREPLRAALHPGWFFLIVLSGFCALQGGFRSGFAALMMTYFVGIWYRGGMLHVVLAGIMGAGAIAALAVVNAVMPLPPNVQRTLTFLPGTWEERYVRDAKGSTEWRMEIWKEVLLTDRWISNKIFGDGLGFNASQLRYQISLEQAQIGRIGFSGWDLQREGVLASGDYHSGPISSVRVVGYVGLLVVVLFQIRLAVHAHRQIMRCRGTEWYPLALMIGIPLIWGPAFFHIVFGDFRSECISLLMGAAMVRMLERNLPLPAYVSKRQRAAAALAEVGQGMVRA